MAAGSRRPPDPPPARYRPEQHAPLRGARINPGRFLALQVLPGLLLVWAVIGENPGQLTLIGRAVIVTTVALHTLRRLTRNESLA